MVQYRYGSNWHEVRWRTVKEKDLRMNSPFSGFQSFKLTYTQDPCSCWLYFYLWTYTMAGAPKDAACSGYLVHWYQVVLSPGWITCYCWDLCSRQQSKWYGSATGFVPQENSIPDGLSKSSPLKTSKNCEYLTDATHLHHTIPSLHRSPWPCLLLFPFRIHLPTQIKIPSPSRMALLSRLVFMRYPGRHEHDISWL